ncbi:hypothetical protein J3R82DRAFT_11363 [Butyriboletus roseoflavus]|nr:hypothetical protein J3R82DRAFT_11363 [Butyriboletus roseoflavus]
MARLRRDTLPVVAPPPLRIFATGAVFLTHSLVLPTHPNPASVSRAHSVHCSRGGAAPHVLALLAQLAATVPAAGDIEPMLIASLGGNPDAFRLRDALEAVGVRTKYCKIWPSLGVPTAWVVHARDTDTRTVINHNPLPEVSHDDFIALLGPVLAPENYVGLNAPQPALVPPPAPRDYQPPPSPVSMFPNALVPSAPRPSISSRPNTAPSTTNATPPPPRSYGIPSPNPHSPAPFDWIHFEGRSARTTIANLVGIDGLARERKWRPHCVISVDLGRRAREGVEVLIPHADVIFLTTTTFSSLSGPAQPGQLAPPSPGVAPSPRAILLSLARHASSHALLVLNAGRDGAALLSLPTSEYLQSSGWTQLHSTRSNPSHSSGHGHSASHATSNGTRTTRTWDSVESVRSGSDFWAGGGPADSSFTSQDSAYTQREDGRSHRHLPSGESFHPMDDDDDEEHGEDGRQTPQPERALEVEEELDEEGAHAAFVAGMIWALSRRVLPGPPYVPGLGPDGEAKGKDTVADMGIRWRLDECLRFATELACRKAHVRADDVAATSVASSSGQARERSEWDGLGEAMRRAGWFD